MKVDPNRCEYIVANWMCCVLTKVLSIQDALRDFFPPIKTKDTRAEFYAAYQRESSQYDHDYVRKYDEDLNTTLVFVSFSCWRFLSVLLIGEGRLVCSRP